MESFSEVPNLQMKSRGIQPINNHPLESPKGPENLRLAGLSWTPRKLEIDSPENIKQFVRLEIGFLE